MTLFLGDEAPNFSSASSTGKLDFHAWMEGSWVAFFSHPKDFTPVCTTELGAIAKLAPQFAERQVKLLGLSVDPVDSHKTWLEEVNETQGTKVEYPLVADDDRKVATLYGMLDQSNKDKAGLPLTVRSFFIIDDKKKIRFIATYPASAGRNFFEFLRVVDSLQLTDKQKLATPANWKPGDDCVVSSSLTTEQAKKVWGDENVTEIKPYLRMVKGAAVQKQTKELKEAEEKAKNDDDKDDKDSKAEKK